MEEYAHHLDFRELEFDLDFFWDSLMILLCNPDSFPSIVVVLALDLFDFFFKILRLNFYYLILDNYKLCLLDASTHFCLFII